MNQVQKPNSSSKTKTKVTPQKPRNFGSSAGKKIFQREGAHNDVPRLTKGQYRDLAMESGELIPTFSGNDSITYAFATSCHINTCEDDLCS